MRIRRVVSHAIRPAPNPPEASRSTNNPPIITVVVKVYFVSCFCNLVQAFYCMVSSLQMCSLVTSWCTLCVGTPKFSEGVMVY